MGKKAFFIIAAIITFFGAEKNIGSTNIYKFNDAENVISKNENYEYKLKNGTELLIDSIISYTKTFIGTPFKWGGNDTKGFDCSGLFHYVFEKFELDIPRTSRKQVQLGESVAIAKVQKGDFLFFKGRNIKDEEVKHVSMVISNENGSITMIHSTHRGTVVDKLDEISYYKERLIEARRINVYEANEDVIINASKLYNGFLR